MYIEVSYCKDHTLCKSEEEIEAFKNANHNIKLIMYSNRRKYLPDSYGEDMVLDFIEKQTTGRVKNKALSF